MRMLTAARPIFIAASCLVFLIAKLQISCLAAIDEKTLYIIALGPHALHYCHPSTKGVANGIKR